MTRLAVWRSPAGQPAWARPLLLAIATLATFTYAWGIGSVNLEPFYGAAARSMSSSWHDFFFGAFDPWGTVSVDKLPGAFWLQALSLRVFGFHLAAIVLPQVMEGAGSVLVLFRAVRRAGGPLAGLVAATVVACSPVTVLLNRGNISDSLLILLLCLAADSTTKGLTTHRARPLVAAGLWVGLAFQAKMLEAWLLLPALFVAWLIAGTPDVLGRRLGTVVLAGLVAAVVSLSWMTVVSLVPAHDRPYVDGSCDNSLFSQVFVYNGLDRTGSVGISTASGCSPPSAFLVNAVKQGSDLGLGTYGVTASWDRLLKGVLGRDSAWLFPPALVAAGSLLWHRRHRPRGDPVRAATILYASWLAIFFASFSTGSYVNSYYLAALVPPIGALCGLGAALAWAERARKSVRLVALVTILGGVAYACALVPSAAGLRDDVFVVTLTVAALAGVVLGGSVVRPASTWSTAVGLAAGALALLCGPAFASGSAVASGEGPFDTPYQPAAVTDASQVVPAHVRRTIWPELVRGADTFPRTMAVDTSESAAFVATDILATGREYLPLGGFTGQVPAPTVRQFERDVAEDKVRRVIAAVDPRSHNPVIRWVIGHCLEQTYGVDRSFTELGTVFRRYLCYPYQAAG